VIFKGRRGSGRHARDERPAGGESGDLDTPSDAGTPDRGPYDISAAPDGVQRLDLGSLHLPAVDGVEVRVQADPDGTVQQVVLVNGDNALQLGVFAAPRSEGIWDEVRDEIRTSLGEQGATIRETDGEYGPELWARVNTPDGPADLRFVGVDGPRWMVRALYQGKAATDPAAAGPLAEVLDGLVVDRGQEAKPVREALPLRLPREVAEQAARDNAPAGDAAPVNGVTTGHQHPHRSEPAPGRGGSA
jgi:hypothetical protein